jgi:hypothetical protein
MSTRTITSPGVEIRESDLSLIAPQNVGTNIFIAGFSSQGPIDEVLKITSPQELDQIYGVPTNSAERYFYHSIGELLNSPANIYTSRLPYGVDMGEGFGSKYSALVYPVKVVAGELGTESQYISGFEINTSFSGGVTGNTSESLAGSQIELQTSAGDIVLIGFDVDGAGSSTTDDETISITSSAAIGTTRAAIASAIDSITDIDASVVGSTIIVELSGYVPLTISADDYPVYGLDSFDNEFPITFNEAGDAFTFTPILSTVSDSAQTITTDMDQSSGAVYVLGEPIHLDLSESEYRKALEGSAFAWESEAKLASQMDTLQEAGHAGVVILNKAQTTVNSQFEGYYVGVADNTNIDPSSDFDSIKSVKALSDVAAQTTGDSFLDVPTGTLQFHLSSDAPYGPTNSVSEIMEKLTDYNIDGREDDDVLNVGEFKLRKSVFATEAFKLDYVLEAGLVGSINEHRHQTNPQGGPTIPFSIETKDSQSRNIEILVNPYISNKHEGGDGLDVNGIPTKKIRVYTEQLANNKNNSQTGISDSAMAALDSAALFETADALYPVGAYTSTKSDTKVLGKVPEKLERALRGVENEEIYDIDVVVEGGLGTVYAMASAAGTTYYDEYESLVTSRVVDNIRTSSEVTNSDAQELLYNYRTVFNIYEQFCSPPHVGGGRGDCVFVADPFRQIFVTGRQNLIGDDKSRPFQTDVYWAIRHQFELENTSYAAQYANWANVYDGQSGRSVWVPFSGFAAAAYARTDAATFPWFAPAGFTRGLVQFANDVAINPNQKQRDELYKINSNPVAFFPSQGNVIYGQKTLSRKPSAFDRINVRRLFLALERPTKKACKYFVFEPNTEFTRTRVKNTLIPIFENAKNNQGVYDYIIVCDERNNTPEVIDNNELVIDIYIKPVRAAEFIRINFFATRTDASFEELING